MGCRQLYDVGTFLPTWMPTWREADFTDPTEREMTNLKSRLTDRVAAKVREPEQGQEFHWCPSTPGFGLRVSSTGDRAYVLERRLDGKTIRRTLGKAAGAKAISADTARKLKITISSELQTGGLGGAQASRTQG